MKTYINTFETLSKSEIKDYVAGQEAVQQYFSDQDQELVEYFEDSEAEYWIEAAKEGLL